MMMMMMMMTNVISGCSDDVDSIMLTCGSSARNSRGARMNGASMMIQVLQNTAMKSFNGISAQYHDHSMMITAVL